MSETAPESADETTDLLVVGGGLGGCVAALAAARERPDATVRLLAPGDRFDAHAGLIDVLGYVPPSPETPVENPFEALSRLPEAHPYRRLGVDTLSEGLAVFDEAVPGYRGGHSRTNALVVTHGGWLKPAARYPASVAPGVASSDEPMAVVGFEQVPDLDADLAADRLNDDLPFAVESHTVDFPGDIREYPSATRLAQALDENEPPSDEHLAGTPDVDTEEAEEADLADILSGADVGDDQPVRQTLAERIEAEIGVQPRVGVPAVLGESAAGTIRRELCERLHARVFEIPTGRPSVLGRRLEARLHEALAEAGVSIETGEVTGVETSDGRIEQVTRADGSHAVSSVVLATGGLAAGGLVAGRADVREPVFDCHVAAPGDRAEWTADGFLDDQPFARCGVAVDDRLRPVDADGEPEYGNLRAVGRLLGGVDYDAEQSADGVAVASGYAAGRWAVQSG
jgi:glycerol-3-phosphate dehydrogenase subunit B